MKLTILLSAAIIAITPLQAESIPNKLIDYPGFLKDAAEVETLREQRRLTEADFKRMASEPATIVLDARSADKFQLLHIQGAINLSLPEFSEKALAEKLPDKDTRVLIYCNNNFENEPIAFTSKIARAALNIYTFNSLYSYGYRNIYELGPVIDINDTILDFEGQKAQP